MAVVDYAVGDLYIHCFAKTYLILENLSFMRTFPQCHFGGVLF